MTDDVATKPPAIRMALDPNNVQVAVVDGIPTFGMIGPTINMTLAVNRIGIANDGSAFDEFVVVARLRFAPEVGRMIRDAIDSQLALLAKPEGKGH